MKLGIVTTTYNRSLLLKRLYNSLREQTDQNFTWIIIDDGSSDDTSSIINDFDSSFDIEYFYKENSGKAKALNYAFSHNRDIDLYVIVDSDDYLLENAVSTIRRRAFEYENENIGGFFFKYQYESGEILGENKKTYSEPVILSRIEHDSIFDKIDGCICYFNKAVQKYKYPEFNHENYVGPIVIQMKMSAEYKIVFLNDVVGVAEYQHGGLTDSGRLLRLKSPKSMMVYCHYMQDEKFSFLTRVKYGIMANAYYYVDKKIKGSKNIMSLNKIRLPKRFRFLGVVLGRYWVNKYQIE